MRKRDSTEGKGFGSEELQTGDAARSMKKIPRIVDIPEEDRTPLVVTLLEIIQLQQEQIQALKDEIARLKGQKPRPKIKPSRTGGEQIQRLPGLHGAGHRVQGIQYSLSP